MNILHVDMDAFYASVEVHKDPSLQGRPVIVGGRGNRGVVTSASYEARAYGVRSAMPMVQARRLCPGAVVVPNDFEAYGEFSRRIRAVFTSFTPLVEHLALDEAWLDVTGAVRLFGPPHQIATALRARVAELGLSCSVGVAPNKFIAKLASRRAKPGGVVVVPSERVEDFLHPMPVEELWGVGEQTAEALRRLGLKTVGDIARLPQRTLERVLGDAQGAALHRLAAGDDDRPVTPSEPAKSVGSEETYAHDLDDPGLVHREILRLSDRTAGRLRAKGLCGRTVTLKIRFSNFKTVTRSRTLEGAVDATPEIYAIARALYDRLNPDRPRIRLVGVGVSGLAPGPPARQLELMSGKSAGWPEATRAVDSIRRRFGERSVGPAALLDADPMRWTT